jgi:hypothetical protein
LVRAGSAPQREPLVTSGQKRSRPASKNRRSRRVQHSDLTQLTSPGLGSSPPSDTPPEQPTLARPSLGVPLRRGRLIQNLIQTPIPAVPPRSDTAGAYLRDWLEAQRPHVAPNTWVTCRNRIAYYLAPSEAYYAAYTARTGQVRPSLAAVRLQDLTPDVASRHLALLLQRGRRDGGGLHPRTVQGVRITLNAALASAYAGGMLLRPVRVKRIAVPKRPPTIYSPEQTGSFLAVAVGDRLAAMWVRSRAITSCFATVPGRIDGAPSFVSTRSKGSSATAIASRK